MPGGIKQLKQRQASLPPRDEAALKARDSLIAFAQRTMPAYQPAAHHELIAKKLEAVERGEIDRLIITMPPQHGKTELASIRFPAWFLGRNPDKRVIGCSYAAALANSISRRARDIVAGDAWPFPNKLNPDAAAVAAWEVDRRDGGYSAAGVGGPITGKTADLLLIDDPFKNLEEADSANRRELVWLWYTATAYTRLRGRGAVVVIQTRWHHDDLAGRLLAAQGAGGDRWEVLHLPALAESNDPLGRREGETLWPAMHGQAVMEQRKTTVGTRVWTALFQGHPSSEEMALFKRDWWKYYSTPPARFDRVILSWDMAFKDTKSSDFVVGQVWGAKGADRFLLAQRRARLSFTATLDAVRKQAAEWPVAGLKLVEDKANGPAVIDTLKVEIPGLVAVNPEGGKYARASAVSPQAEAGNVWLPDPRIHPWVHDFVQECADFPTGVHDDQVDAMSQALLRLAREALPFGWMDDGAIEADFTEGGVPAVAAPPPTNWWDGAGDDDATYATGGPYACPECDRAHGSYEQLLIHWRQCPVRFAEPPPPEEPWYPAEERDAELVEAHR